VNYSHSYHYIQKIFFVQLNKLLEKEIISPVIDSDLAKEINHFDKLVGFITPYNNKEIEKILTEEIYQLMYYGKFSYDDAYKLSFKERRIFFECIKKTLTKNPAGVVDIEDADVNAFGNPNIK
jgi:hypothetical protein